MTAFEFQRYTWGDQPQTRGGRELETIDGDADAIIARGHQIERLGELMQRAAATLQLFADGSLGEGGSMDKIRDQAGEVHEDLGAAGRLYYPSGSTLVDYGRALRDVQDDTDSRVPSSISAWESVREAALLLEEARDAQSDFDDRAEDADDDEDLGTRPSTGAQQAEFDSAEAAWHGYWSGYDSPVATWEQAYVTATNGLQGANQSGPEDGFWDNAMPFVEGLLTVLAVIGIIAFVVCFFVTGPLALVLGAIALVAGIVSVALEASKFLAGRGDWLSLGLSIVSVIPFTKLATLGRVVDLGSDVSRMSRFTGVVRHLGSDFVDAAAAIGRRNTTFFGGARNFTNSGFLPAIPFENLAADIGFYLFKEPPQLIAGNGPRILNLAGFPPGTSPTNLVEALAGTTQAMGSTLSNVDAALGLANAGRHE